MNFLKNSSRKIQVWLFQALQVNASTKYVLIMIYTNKISKGSFYSAVFQLYIFQTQVHERRRFIYQKEIEIFVISHQNVGYYRKKARLRYPRKLQDM